MTSPALFNADFAQDVLFEEVKQMETVSIAYERKRNYMNKT